MVEIRLAGGVSMTSSNVGSSKAPERLVKRIALDPKVITQESEAAA